MRGALAIRRQSVLSRNIRSQKHVQLERSPSAYEACNKCEQKVVIANEELRQLLYVQGGLSFQKKKRGVSGYILLNAVPLLGLAAGDRVDPSAELPDIGKLKTAALPLVVTFWRGIFKCQKEPTKNRTKCKTIAAQTVNSWSRAF